MGMFILAAVVGYLVKDIVLTKGFAYYFTVQSILMFILGNVIWKTLAKMKAKHSDKYKEF